MERKLPIFALKDQGVPLKAFEIYHCWAIKCSETSKIQYPWCTGRLWWELQPSVIYVEVKRNVFNEAKWERIVENNGRSD